MTAQPTLAALGEDAVLLQFDERIDAGINAAVHALAARIQARRPAGLVEIVPAFACLALRFDLDRLAAGHSALDAARACLAATRIDDNDDEPVASPRLHEIVVRYGGDAGPDLPVVAEQAGLDVETVIARHTGGDYQVAMLGFAPGFPYLLGLDPALATPRRATPRTEVAAGSVGIGGAQTGIYPQRGPGGWQIIGRTDAVLFDAGRQLPTLLAPGDRVRFLDARKVRA